MDIVPNEPGARIGLITAYDSWWKDSSMLNYVVESDIFHVDKWVCFATAYWVRHATGTSAVRLLLLLWTDVNTPPNWIVNRDVVIDNVSNLST